MKYYILTYIGKPIGESGESCKTSYNFDNACNICGTGAQVMGSLRTKGINKERKEHFFLTLDDDEIISEELYALLKKSRIKIENLKKIVDFRNNELDFYHLKTDFYFPKAKRIEGLIIENQCCFCNKNGYFVDAIIGDLEKNIPTKIIPLKVYYSNIDKNLLNQSDIFYTWEHLGLSNRKIERGIIVRYARSLLIISERLKDLLNENKIKYLHFDQIIVDGNR